MEAGYPSILFTYNFFALSDLCLKRPSSFFIWLDIRLPYPISGWIPVIKRPDYSAGPIFGASLMQYCRTMTNLV